MTKQLNCERFEPRSHFKSRLSWSCRFREHRHREVCLSRIWYQSYALKCWKQNKTKTKTLFPQKWLECRLINRPEIKDTISVCYKSKGFDSRFILKCFASWVFQQLKVFIWLRGSISAFHLTFFIYNHFQVIFFSLMIEFILAVKSTTFCINRRSFAHRFLDLVVIWKNHSIWVSMYLARKWLIGDTIFKSPTGNGTYRYLTWSSEPRKGVPVCGRGKGSTFVSQLFLDPEYWVLVRPRE